MFQKRYTTLIVISLLCVIQLSASSVLSPPTTPSSNLQFFSVQGNRLFMNWTKGDGARRIVVARENMAVSSFPVNSIDYNANAQYGNGDLLGPDEFIVYDGAGNSLTLSNLNHSSTYHFRIYEYNGSDFSTEYLTLTYEEASQVTLSPPAIQTSAINFSEITGHSFKIDWVNGDGSGRLIVLKEGSAVNAVPQHYSAYNANANFGNGSELGTENFIIYKGSGSFVTINNLEPDKVYHLAIFEYNGSNGPVYLSPAATSSQLTAGAPTIEATNLFFSSIDGNRLNTNFTKGNGARRLIIIKKGSPVTATPVDGVQYLTSSTYGNGTEIAANEFVVYASNGINALVSGLEHSSSYYVKIFEYNGTGTNTKYLTAAPLQGDEATLFPPTTATQNIIFSNVTGNSMTINWTNGDGASRLIVVKEGNPVDFVPVDYLNYNVSTSYGNNSSHLGNGNYSVYRFSGTTVSITNLSPNTVYHIAAFERNGTSGPIYLSPGTTASQQTVGDPSIPPSNLTFNNIEGGKMSINWTNGDGAKRLVIAKKGSPVSTIPVDGATYTANFIFGNGDELGTDEFVVYNGPSSNVSLQNLVHSSTYHFRVFEYNGSGANTFYLTANFGSSSQSTLFPPTVATSNIVFSNLSPVSVQLDLTPGNGSRRIIIAQKVAAVDFAPQHYQTYYTNPAYGSNLSQINSTENYTVYSFTGNTVTVTDLEPGIVYHFAVFEYNGIVSPAYASIAFRAEVTLPFLPTTQGSNLQFNTVGATQFGVIWTKGNGYKRVVLAKKGALVDAEPIDGIDYTASDFFGTGDELGTGNFVVYNGQNSNFTLKSLEVDSTYHLAIFEYGGFGVNATYLKPPHIDSQATVMKPLVSPSAVTVSNLTSTTTTIGWTNGDGTGRLVVLSADEPLNALPIDGASYSSDFRFGEGTTIGNGFVLYKGTGTSANIISLTEGTTYYINVFEYNGISTSPAFRETPGTENSTTSGPPATQTSALVTAVLNTTSIQLSWTNGTGQKRIVLIKEGNAVDEMPLDGFDYTANAGFGSGDELGTDNFVVHSGPENSVIISGLTDGTTYHLAVFEYNFSGTATRYLLANPPTITTTVLPVQLTSFTGKAIKNDIVLEWQTVTELNNDYFELQHARDGHQFSTFAKVTGNGSSFTPINYTYLHENVQNGSHYYRLRQVDFDGKSQFSSIINIHQRHSAFTINVYPNPVNEQLNILFTAPTKQAIKAYLFDYTSKMVQEISIPKGIKIYVLEVKNLPMGWYQFIMEGEEGVFTFVKE